jgi:hypothetical protein
LKKNKIVFELNVPSGIMIFSDGLPGFCYPGQYDINTNEGTIKAMLKMASIGCAEGYVGNSCPNVFQADGKNLMVAGKLPKGYRGNYVRVDQIVTDYWWYAFADLEEFKRRTDANPDQFRQVKVTPGVYRFVHTLPGKRDPAVYATITWVREPDPVKDYLKEYREMNFTAGQIVGNHMHFWEYTHKEEIDLAIMEADYIFCVIGTGISWHPNGFAQYDPDMPANLEDMEIPAFDKPFDWYPLSEYSGLVRAANGEIRLNASFAALAKKVARSIIDYGTNKYPANREIARNCLMKLEKLYPES